MTGGIRANQEHGCCLGEHTSLTSKTHQCVTYPAPPRHACQLSFCPKFGCYLFLTLFIFLLMRQSLFNIMIHTFSLSFTPDGRWWCFLGMMLSLFVFTFFFLFFCPCKLINFCQMVSLPFVDTPNPIIFGHGLQRAKQWENMIKDTSPSPRSGRSREGNGA